ncbi:MAG: TRAP transporter small permease subunit [Cellvibrionaceae bacterium]|nr:TRAP transporter small permease subunit [Cellvibrionaceae bacterium]MCV6624959.1 TRAP transporter small permease subunit [Cellvibrionaceae bacterium]
MPSPIQASAYLADLMDAFSEALGKLVSWLTIFMVVATCIVVVLRYLLNIGATALQDSVTYMHATVFLLGAAYTLNKGGQVRVDVFYRNFNLRQKAWIDAIGSVLFLLPLCGLIFFTSLDYVANSWAVKETARDTNGLPYVYLLKTLLPLAAFTLALQAIGETCHALATLMSPAHQTHTGKHQGGRHHGEYYHD